MVFANWVTYIYTSKCTCHTLTYLDCYMLPQSTQFTVPIPRCCFHGQSSTPILILCMAIATQCFVFYACPLYKPSYLPLSIYAYLIWLPSRLVCYTYVPVISCSCTQSVLCVYLLLCLPISTIPTCYGYLQWTGLLLHACLLVSLVSCVSTQLPMPIPIASHIAIHMVKSQVATQLLSLSSYLQDLCLFSLLLWLPTVSFACLVFSIHAQSTMPLCCLQPALSNQLACLQFAGTFMHITCLLYMSIQLDMPKQSSKCPITAPIAFCLYATSFNNLRSILSNRTYSTKPLYRN